MTEREFKDRTKRFGVRVIRMVGTFSHGVASDVLAKQIVRSATSVGANYRAACRARSTAEMISKLSIVEEEADETAFWIEMLIEADIVQPSQAKELLGEANELVAMIVASKKTLKSHKIENRKSEI